MLLRKDYKYTDKDNKLFGPLLMFFDRYDDIVFMYMLFNTVNGINLSMDKDSSSKRYFIKDKLNGRMEPIYYMINGLYSHNLFKKKRKEKKKNHNISGDNHVAQTTDYKYRKISGR